MYVNPKLTDEEVCRKFEITRDDPSFATARGLSDNRHDTSGAVWPDIDCPHCCETTTFTGPFAEGGWCEGDMIVCSKCERIMWVEHIEVDRDGIYMTLCTEPMP